MDDKQETVVLRGVVISREDIEERYTCKLTDIEWKIFRSSIIKSWKEDEGEIRRLVFKHIKTTFNEMDYKLELSGKDLIFKKKI